MKVLNTSFRVAAIAAALSVPAAIAATPPPPATVLYGGGATFPAEAFIGSSFLKTLGNPRRLSQTTGVLPPSVVSDPLEVPDPQVFNPTDSSPAAVADKTTLFGAFALANPTIGVSYCQTGSGRGKQVLNGANAGTNACKDYGVSQDGFSIPGPAPMDTDFSASDSPLNQAEVNTFNTNKAARGQPVQLPAVAGSIAFVYNNPALGKKKLNLTRSDICGIFSGTITDWSQLTHTPKVTIAAKPIKVIYRSDNSGTTFSFLNFLSQACPSLTLPGDVATASDRFKMVDGYATGGAPLPSGAIGASGNGGIVTTVAQTDGAIGYADIANGLARAKIAGGVITYATVSYAADQPKEPLIIAPEGSAVCKAGTLGKIKDVNDGKAAGPGNPVGGTTLEPITTVVNPSTTKSLKFTCPAITYNKLDPAKNLIPKGATSIAVTTEPGKVLSTVNPATGRVSLIDVTGLPPATASCLQTVDPANYAQPLPAQTKKAVADFDRYPVIAVSYLLTYSNGHGSKLAAVRSLVKAPFDAAVLAKTKTIGKASGFQPIALTNAASTTPVFAANSANAFVDACVID
jgi:phosphate transport system substrate-binding protein